MNFMPRLAGTVNLQIATSQIAGIIGMTPGLDFPGKFINIKFIISLLLNFYWHSNLTPLSQN
jgi:hypothetical protein